MDAKLARHLLVTATGLLLVFGFGCLPPIEPITPMGMRILGIFIGMIFLWSFTDLIWSSLLGILAIVMAGYAPLARVIHMSFGDRVPVLLLLTMILFGAIQESGLISYIARWFLTRRCINGKPVMFSFVFMYCTYVLAAMSASILPALLFMWAILYNMLKEVGYKRGDAYTAIMVLGTFFGAISGQASKPFTGSALMIVGAYEKVSGIPLDYLDYMLFGFIMSSAGIILYALLIRFVFRPDMSRIRDISIERFQRDPLPPVNFVQKVMACALVSFLVLIMAPSIFPADIPVVAMLKRVGPIGVCLILIVILSIMRHEGRPLFNFRQVASRHVQWAVFILVSMAMAISGAMMDPVTGITRFMAQALEPIARGTTFPVFVALLSATSCLIPQVANNGVVGVLLMPVIGYFCEQSGGNFPGVATLVIFMLHMSILTPAGSIFSAILFGNKEWISGRGIVRYGCVVVIMCIAFYTVVGLPLMNVIFTS